MPESSIVVRPESPDSPTYTAAARLQAAGLQSAIALFVEAAQQVPLPKPPQPIVIADYGASTGHNSLLPINEAITALRTRIRKEHAILIAHTDVAENDFTALFQTLAEDPDSYLNRDPAVFASAVGRSFYQQILPSHSISLGWSSWAIHWLSRLSAPVPDHLVPAFSSDVQVRTACARQAAQDWHEFIAFRGRELAPEGRLVVLTMGEDADGTPGLRSLIDATYATLLEFVDTGLISTDELHSMALPIVGRSERDFVAPFAPKGLFEGLSIERLEIDNAEDRFFQQFQVHNDPQVFGRQWASFMRAVGFPTLVAALTGDPHDARAEEFGDKLEQGISERLAASPKRMDIPLAKVVLRKNPRN